MNIDETADELLEFYGEDTVLPSRAQWYQLLSSAHDGPICMVNFMKFRDMAQYTDGEAVSGMEALMRYQAVSQKVVEEVGGEFIVSGLFGGIMIGEAEDWDAIGVVRYPNRQAFIDVFRNPEYRRNHHHRIAGTLRHRMAVVLE